ncbi:thioredoxin M3, chloroplastic [Mangifera indica]|uniref:thioredoxin M3, chloroplastic n=1 Tax=Mangifera indica TaxID=29780 RepID=UPI001CF970F2|nr:thioredoxin M3, chloroplastic [Mangifera indica]
MASTNSSCFSSAHLAASRVPSLPSRTLTPSANTISFSFRLLPKTATLKTRKAPFSLKILCMRESKAVVVTKDSWEKSILKSDTPVLVEFYASWCGPCRMVHRVIDEIAGEYTGKLKCYMLNTDSDLQIAEDYEVKAVPVVLLFKNGVKRETVVGTMPKDFYISAIERVLES